MIASQARPFPYVRGNRVRGPGVQPPARGGGCVRVRNQILPLPRGLPSLKTAIGAGTGKHASRTIRIFSSTDAPPDPSPHVRSNRARGVIFCSFFGFAEIFTFPGASIIHSLSSIFAPGVHTSGRTGSDQPGGREHHKPYDAIC